MKKGSILAFALVAAALSQTAGAITATKEYVDRKNTEIRTNTYTKAETDARIGELRTGFETGEHAAALAGWADNAGWTEKAYEADYAFELGRDGSSRSAETIFSQIDARTSTNDVCAIVTSEVDRWEVITDAPFDTSNWWLEWSESQGNHYVTVYDETGCISGSAVEAGASRVDFGVDWAYGPQYTLTIVKVARNALGLARRSDITNTVTKAYVEGLGIEAGISDETATNIAESVVNATVTGVVRAVSFKVKDYIFDPVTEICWRRQMVNGFLDYIAVTNIDVTLPENYEALEALERRDNQ